MGPPGAGKGTVSECLVKEFHFLHVSPGELLREEIRKGTTIGKEIQKYTEKGSLVPDNFVVEMVKLEVKGKDNFILDGFPRTLRQAEETAELEIDLVINLEVPENVVVERFAGRRDCPKCGASYHLIYIPPKKSGICDQCGTALIQRKDDVPEVIKERFHVYNKDTQPLINHYKKKKLLQIVDASQPPEKVCADAKKVIQTRLK